MMICVRQRGGIVSVFVTLLGEHVTSQTRNRMYHDFELVVCNWRSVV